jgi:hypothetical protein
MGLNKDTVAKRMTAVPADIIATLTPADSTGKRDLFEYKGDKYGTVHIRAYVPEGVSLKGLDGHVLDFNAKGTQAEEADDNTRKRELVARSVIMLTKAGKFASYGNMTDDAYDTGTVLIVINIPNWASVDTITLSV